MKPNEIALKINTYLKNAERDKTNCLYKARAYASGRWIYIVYVTYQGRSHLSRTEATQYLKWLDQNPDRFSRHHSVLQNL